MRGTGLQRTGKHRKRTRIVLHTIVDPLDQAQQQVCQVALRRVDEAGALVVQSDEADPDALVVLVTHGNSAREIVAAVEGVGCPAIVWAARERWAWPSSALAMGRLREEGRSVALVYGQPDEDGAFAAFRQALRSAAALSQLARSRIGVIGGVYPNLVSCSYDRAAIKAALGVDIVDIPFDAVRAGVAAVREDQEAACVARALTLHTVKADLTGRHRAGVRLHLALQQVARHHGLDGYAVECWSRLPEELGTNPCFGFVEDSYIMACEGDVLLAVTLIVARALTGACPYAGDLYDLDRQGVLALRHCGAPMSLARDPKAAVIDESAQASERGFPTPVCRPQLAPGPVTLLRVYGASCQTVHMARGELIDAESQREMVVRVRICGNRRHFVDHCTGNHYVVVPGDVAEEIRLIARWKGMELFDSSAAGPGHAG